ncbi:MAG: helix-turn-helix domain-containing protein [Acidobacteriota bacterium]
MSAELMERIEPQTDDDLLNIDEAAAFLRVKKRFLYERTSRGTIPHLKIGRFVMFRRSKLIEWGEQEAQKK